MDRAALRARLRTLSGVLMDTLLSDTEANAYLDAANFTVCSLAEWTFLYDEDTVAVTTDTALLPGSIGRVQDVTVDGVALQRRTLAELARYPTGRRTRAPWAWAVLGDDAIRLFPTPASSVTATVRGWVDVPSLASDTDEPLFAAEFHEVVAYEAAAAVLEAEGDDSGRAVDFRREVQSHLDRMARRYLPDGGQIAYPPTSRAAAEEEGGE